MLLNISQLQPKTVIPELDPCPTSALGEWHGVQQSLWSSFALLLLFACPLLSPQRACGESNSALAYTFTTLAGKPGGGSADGVGDTAQFLAPNSVALDNAGNIYVADGVNNTIRRITPAGVVTTIAGFAGVPGTTDGSNSGARFGFSLGIAGDAGGALYVADRGNNTIRRIAPMGTNWVVATIAGSPGACGTNDGIGANARFDYPSDIAVDSATNLYVTDSFNQTVRKITPMAGIWVVSTIAGCPGRDGPNDGSGTNAQFSYPSGIAVDGASNLYVADTSNQTIRKISQLGSNWTVRTIAGLAGEPGSADGVGSAARFRFPYGIAVDSLDNLFVADTHNATIRKIAVVGGNWLVGTVAGNPFAGPFLEDADPISSGYADGTGTNALFYFPTGLAVDGTGNLFVADSGNDAIRSITSAGVVSTVAGRPDSSGSANGTGSAARFSSPQGIAVDGADRIYIGDANNNTIRKMTAAGVVSTLAGRAGHPGYADGIGDNARFDNPSGVTVDPSGNIFVADSLNNRIRKVTAAGIVSTLGGSVTNAGSTDGTNALFYRPLGVAADGGGNLYVADTLNHTIRKMTPLGTNWRTITIAGFAGSQGTNDGVGSNARFDHPDGLAVNAFSNIFVADSHNHTIRRITPMGTNWIVSTIAGTAGQFGSDDGTGSTAHFYNPPGVAVDQAGNVFVADAFNNTIRKIVSAGNNWVVSTIAGRSNIELPFGSADGTGEAALFNNPFGVAVDKNGKLYITDASNNTIRNGMFSGYAPMNSMPYSQPSMNGRLEVTMLPPEANGRWRFPWEFGWHNSGYTASNLVAGNYQIEFRSVPGWLTVPLAGPATLTNGAAVFITNYYYPTVSAGDTSSGAGSLTVILGPTPPSGAGWRFLGENTPYFTNVFTTNLLSGGYLIEFAPVSGRIKPASQTVRIDAGQSTYLSVNYLVATPPPANVYLPFPVPANQVSDEPAYPFGFNGQLQSDNGYGSGVAVLSNVVLTAAHLIFNDQTLSYVNRAHWFFRRDVGVGEPQPQAARGFYVLTGYAAQRTNDLNSGYSPDQSTPPSRNLDVAALYFLEPVAGGGYGGYLPSDAAPNTWLTSTALKMLVGYPVDGSQFGDASIVPGRMYQTDPQPYPLSLATDPVPGQQQVYLAPWFLSYPGNSGGPLYVQLNGYYYPAAVYLGTLSFQHSGIRSLEFT